MSDSRHMLLSLTGSKNEVTSLEVSRPYEYLTEMLVHENEKVKKMYELKKNSINLDYTFMGWGCNAILFVVRAVGLLLGVPLLYITESSDDDRFSTEKYSNDLENGFVIKKNDRNYLFLLPESLKVEDIDNQELKFDLTDETRSGYEAIYRLV